MKKILALAIAASLAVSALCGCSMFQKNKGASPEPTTTVSTPAADESSDASQNSQSETPAAPESPNANINDGTSSLSFEFELEGKKLSIPCAYKDFANLGFTVKKDEPLKKNTYTIGTYLTNSSGASLSTAIWNPSNEKKLYSECQIGRVEFEVKDNCNLKLAKGFVLTENTTVEDIVAVYGEPDNKIEGKDYIALNYGSGYSEIKFMLNTSADMKKYNSVTIENMDQ